MKRPSIDALAKGIKAGDTALLARAITLVESKNPAHRQDAQALLLKLQKQTPQNKPPAHRIGITGVPGVGKSTFIEAFGSMLCDLGKRVAVLAVDPTSRRTGGSILGDKTRMEKLGANPLAYIRPSPAGATLGGVSAMTRESMSLCEAAGYDVILVETVGVGQSETLVADMVDFFLVLMLPGAGDELQGIKKGILEIADMICVNKADGENGERRAKIAAREYASALSIMTPASQIWTPPVAVCSGLKGTGLDKVWELAVDHNDKMTASGEFKTRRTAQQIRWMHQMIEDRLLARVHDNPAIKARLKELEANITAGKTTPVLAVQEVLGLIDKP